LKYLKINKNIKIKIKFEKLPISIEYLNYLKINKNIKIKIKFLNIEITMKELLLT
jgi:hypothetical protein